MFGWLRAIFAALGEVIAGQVRAAEQAAADRAALDAGLADVHARQQALDAAIEHLRELIEGDTLVASVGTPTFTPTGGTK